MPAEAQNPPKIKRKNIAISKIFLCDQKREGEQVPVD